ncbi:hypothetical protein GUJ93_ZPchr0012g20811 [Zizania palustris]|uniref:Uncharacterized protein n=1 Tax=Zizania palustris TaxID=103762 RepID=A0A8J5WN41_ZIZPA|nr:hypothetical protein GUJ93_ZPchr0012g20811 [Zizania palustris]
MGRCNQAQHRMAAIGSHPSLIGSGSSKSSWRHGGPRNPGSFLLRPGLHKLMGRWEEAQDWIPSGAVELRGSVRRRAAHPRAPGPARLP